MSSGKAMNGNVTGFCMHEKLIKNWTPDLFYGATQKEYIPWVTSFPLPWRNQGHLFLCALKV